MHDEEHTRDTEAELPAPESSSFFASSPDSAEKPSAESAPDAASVSESATDLEPVPALEGSAPAVEESAPAVESDHGPEPTPEAASESEGPKRWGLFGRRKKKAAPAETPAETPAEPPAEPPAESASAETDQAASAASDLGTATSEPTSQPESPSTDAASAQGDPDSTQPYTPIPEEDADAQAGQLTQLLPEIDTDSSMYFDPESSQFTVVMPLVDAESTAQTPASELPTSPETLATVVAGSRVVIVISKGASEIAPASMATVPVVARALQGAALSQLQQAGLSAQVFNEYSDLPRGEVLGQWPSAGQSVPTGSEAVLLVSNGPAPADALLVPLPEVVGLSEADALAALQAAGLSPQIVREYSQSIPLGAVIAQLPHGRVDTAPTKKPKGEAASLWWLWALLAFAVLFAVSGGVYYYVNRSAAVPNLIGLTHAQAEEALDAAGFKAGSVTTTQSLDASQVGKVIGQSPTPNSQLRLIDKVNLTISGGQKLFAVPDVLGRTQDEARSIMATAGLQVSLSQNYSATVPKDAVISQSPPAGERVPYQTTVGLTVSLGVQNVTVPGVGGLTRSDAANRLKAANLGSQAVVEYTYAGAAKGLVFAQYPTAGMQIAPGTIVGLLVSNGPPPSKSPSSTPTPGQLATVPSVVGQGLKSAQSTLKKANLSNTIINWSGTGRPAGEVVGQAPEVNTTMPRGVAVIIFVSNGK